MRNALYSSVAAAGLLFGIVDPAQAQVETSSDQKSESTGLETIVVTAQRREESLQDAAVAIDAMSEVQLVRQGVESAVNIAAISPSLGIAQAGGGIVSIFVRGVGSPTANPLQDAAVAQNYDGVYLGRSTAATAQGLFDMERIELLKGPQGTLYGRNATGGVLNYIPRKPILGEVSGYGQLDVGNYDKIGAQAALNVPVGDNIAFRFSGNILDRDGYSSDGSNDADMQAVRAQVLFEPTDRFAIRLAFDHTEVGGVGSGGDVTGTYNTDPTSGRITDFIPSGVPIDSGPTSALSNAARATILSAPAFAFYQPVNSDEIFQDFRFTGFLAEMNLETDLGTLTVIPAYRESKQDYAYYGAGYGPTTTLETQDQFSIEARFVTDLDGPFNGVFGAFYFDENIEFAGNFNQDYVAAVQSYAPESESWAIFAQGTVDLNDRLRLNGGIRYTEDTKSVTSNYDHVYLVFCGTPFDLITPPDSFAVGCPGHPALPSTYDEQEFINILIDTGQIAPGSTPDDGFYPIISGIPGSILDAGTTNIPDSSLSYGEFTYRLGIEWDIGDDSLFYAGYERGYRSGGVDVSVASPTYDPEFIDAFTIGMKNRFFGNTLQINAELFYWEYKDQQISYFANLGGAPAFLTTNADSTIKGLDLDLLWAATSNTTFGAKFQYLDAKFDQLSLLSDPNGGRFGCPSNGVGADGFETFDCSGIGLLFSPEIALDLMVNHVIEIGNFDLSGTADLSYRSSQETDFSLLPQTQTDAYTTLNLQMDLSPSDGPWTLTAYVRNVFDERYITSSNVAGYGLLTSQFNPPRTYGVRARFEF